MIDRQHLATSRFGRNLPTFVTATRIGDSRLARRHTRRGDLCSLATWRGGRREGVCRAASLDHDPETTIGGGIQKCQLRACNPDSGGMLTTQPPLCYFHRDSPTPRRSQALRDGAKGKRSVSTAPPKHDGPGDSRFRQAYPAKHLCLFGF